ncbi:MAG: hypothetical protein RR619_03205, partial [Raoultibacter sp.]
MMDTSKLSPVQTRGGVQSASVSSKVLKVLLALILAIGLMPAINTQQAFAAADSITFDYVVGDQTESADTATNAYVEGVYGYANGVLTLSSDITNLEFGASVTNVTIKAASGQPVSISTEDAAAISTSATQSLILDGTGAAISVKSVKGAADTKLSEAIKALGKVTVKGNVVVANENPDTDAVDVTADGVEIAAGANLTADVASTKDVSITGTITGNVNAAANAVSVSLSSSSTGTVTGNVDGAAITVD